MLLSLDRLRGYEIGATDGTLGKANDFLFDDSYWTIRYAVVDTGWLFGRTVLVAPEAIKAVDTAADEILVSHTKKELEEAPGISTALPVSRQEENLLRQHYGLPTYWNLDPGGLGMAPLVPPARTPDDNPSVNADMRERRDPNLRSAREVEGYHIEARDGEIGHVEDFIVEEGTWAIRYVVVDTRNWLPGRKVLISPEWVTAVDWSEGLVRVSVEQDDVKNSPAYEPENHINRAYETSLFEHYQSGPYWV